MRIKRRARNFLLLTVMPVLRRRLKPLVDRRTWTIRNGLAAGLKRRGGLDFFPRSLSKEEQFLQTLDFENKVVYDIGAYQGLFTLFFARSVGASGQVITFEPNPINFERTFENVKLNGFSNVTVLPIGIGKESARVPQVFHPDNTAMASADERAFETLMQRKGAKRVDIEIDTLDHLIQARQLPRPDFIKIDVEGLELDVLAGMAQTLRNDAPAMLIEVHGLGEAARKEMFCAVTSRLIDQGYSVTHVESGIRLTPDRAPESGDGHVYCTHA